MNRLEDMAGMIEIDETELGASSIDTSQLKDSNGGAEKPTQEETTIIDTTSSQGGVLLEVEEDEFNNEVDPVIRDTNVNVSEEDEEDVNTNTFKAFSTLLKSSGVLPNIEDTDLESVENAQGILNLLNKQLTIVNKEYQDGYKQNLVSNLVKDGYITEDQIAKKLPKVHDEESIKNNEDAAIETIRSFYREKDIPEAQIDNIVKGVIDLEEEALRLLPYMEEIKTTKEQAIADDFKRKEDEELSQKQQFDSTLKNAVYDIKEFIPGRPLKETEKEAVYNNIIPVLNKINSDLAKYAPVIAYLDKYNFLEGDMTKIFNELGSKQVSSFEKIITSKKKGSSAGNRIINKDAPQGISKSGGLYNIYG